MAFFEPLLATLNSASVRYVVVGGLAVVLHGHARLTADLDLIIDLDPEEARKAVDTLVSAGFVPQIPVPPQQFTDAATRKAWIRDKGMQVFSMWNPSQPMAVVDLFVEHPIPFEELWARSVIMDLGQTEVRIAAIEDLIRLKQQAARPQDLADIEKLRQIQRLKEGAA